MGLIRAVLPQRFHGVWTWARTGRTVVDLEGSMLDIRFIIIKSYLTAIWACNARGFICTSRQSMEKAIDLQGRGCKLSCMVDLQETCLTYEKYLCMRTIAHHIS